MLVVVEKAIYQAQSLKQVKQNKISQSYLLCLNRDLCVKILSVTL